MHANGLLMFINVNVILAFNLAITAFAISVTYFNESLFFFCHIYSHSSMTFASPLSFSNVNQSLLYLSSIAVLLDNLLIKSSVIPSIQFVKLILYAYVGHLVPWYVYRCRCDLVVMTSLVLKEFRDQACLQC